jgi:PAS domain S-box-containing protein
MSDPQYWSSDLHEELRLLRRRVAELEARDPDRNAVEERLRRLYEAEQTARGHSETLLAAARALGSSLQLPDVLRTILEQLGRVLPCDSASVQEIRANHTVIVAGIGFDDVDEIIGIEFDIGNPAIPNGVVIESRKPLILGDVHSFGEFRNANPKAGHIRSWMGVPLIASNAVVGLLTLDKNDPHFYTDEHADLAMAFATQAAMAIENARLYAAAREETRARSRVEARLHLSEASYRTLVEQLPAITYRWSVAENKTAYISPQVETLLGYTPEEWIADPDLWWKVLHPDDREWVMAEMARKDQMGTDVDLTHRLMTRDGRVVWIQNQSRTVFDGQKPVETHGVMLDVTHLKQVEARLRQTQEALLRAKETADDASRAKSSFLATMSHELRTPLNAIIGFSSVLDARISDKLDEKQRRFLRNINVSGEYLLHLINDILDLSKIEAGKMVMEEEDVDAEECLDAICRVVRGMALPRNIDLRMELQPDLGFVRADPVRLKQILFNLLSNAVKFSPDGASVVTRARILPPNESHLHRPSLEISVLDHGPGIAPEDRQVIFEEFRQLQGDSRRPQGTGLGLALVNRLVQLMGGTIRLRSEVGRGSEFIVTLPRGVRG